MKVPISRIEKWVNSKDIAGISAFRFELKNVTSNTLLDKEVDKKELSRYTKKENLQRNIKLKSALLKLKYGITRIAGSFIEGGDSEVQEESFIVVNLNDDPDFKNNIFKLSEYYNQDSFLYKPKDSDVAFLIGTNYDDYVGYKNEKLTGKFYKKVSAQFMSRLGPQGFAFSKNDGENPLLPDKPYTFQDRKDARKKGNEVREMKDIFRIDTFDELQNSSKWLCSVEAKPLLEMLGKTLN